MTDYYDDGPTLGGVIATAVAVVLVIATIVVGIVWANNVYNNDKTEQLRICLAAGGHWTNDGCQS